MSDWVQTFTGKQFRPLSPEASAVCVEDIAHALSQICRFTGHTRRFYSVAEHCVRASYLAAKCRADGLRALTLTTPDTPEVDEAELRTYARFALLHDASEAYLCDIARPLKRQPAFLPYLEAERRLQETILRAFGLNPDEEPKGTIGFVDALMLSTEKAELLGQEPASWGVLPDPLPRQNLGWDPVFAEGQFLFRFRELFEDSYA